MVLPRNFSVAVLATDLDHHEMSPRNISGWSRSEDILDIEWGIKLVFVFSIVAIHGGNNV